MANKMNGEVSLQACGETFTLRFSIPTLDALEDAVDMPSAEIVQKLCGRPRLKLVRAVLRAALAEFQPNLPAAKADEILRELGLLPTVLELIKTFGAAFPGAEDSEQTEGPPTAAGGTGSDASTSGSSSISETLPPSGD